ncbi:MAG: hypothetical protein MZV65_01390 [Chromatiales bacterium]|nr:hypothetical protein [Chromatiales bacterium]
MELAQRQQAFLLDARRYAEDLDELGNPPVPQRVQDFFGTATITIATSNPRPNFTIQIDAKAGTMQVSDAAATMTITHDGIKTPAAYW